MPPNNEASPLNQVSVAKVPPSLDVPVPLISKSLLINLRGFEKFEILLNLPQPIPRVKLYDSLLKVEARYSLAKYP